MFSLFIDEVKLDKQVVNHLQLNGSRGTTGNDITITVYPYGDIKQFVESFQGEGNGKTWVINSMYSPGYVISQV